MSQRSGNTTECFTCTRRKCVAPHHAANANAAARIIQPFARPKFQNPSGLVTPAGAWFHVPLLANSFRDCCQVPLPKKNGRLATECCYTRHKLSELSYSIHLRIADVAKFWISIFSCSFTGSLHLSVTLWCFLFCIPWAEHADHGVCHHVHMGTAGCSASTSWMVWRTGTSNCIHQLLTNCDSPFSIIQCCAELRCGHSVWWVSFVIWNICHASCHLTRCLQAWHLGPQSGNPAWLLSKQPSSQRTMLQSPMLVRGCAAMPPGAALVHPCNHGLRWPIVSRGRQLKNVLKRGIPHSSTPPQMGVLSWELRGQWKLSPCVDQEALTLECRRSPQCCQLDLQLLQHCGPHPRSCSAIIGLHCHFHGCTSLHGCISLHRSSKPTKQSEHEGQDHHQTKNRSENEKVPSMVHWAFITAALQIQEAQGAHQCPTLSRLMKTLPGSSPPSRAPTSLL